MKISAISGGGERRKSSVLQTICVTKSDTKKGDLSESPFL
jgi:hypothetical protein